jgi:hypothetical protein
MNTRDRVLMCVWVVGLSTILAIAVPKAIDHNYQQQYVEVGE